MGNWLAQSKSTGFNEKKYVYLYNKDTNRIKVKGCKMICHANTKEKKDGELSNFQNGIKELQKSSPP